MRRANRSDSIEAQYDAALTTEQNQGAWSRADLLSADAANSPEVRKMLRSRSRYECLEANPFAYGIVKTLAHETIGTGPILQMGLEKSEVNELFESRFRKWVKRIKLGQKLRTARKSKFVDGESFIRLVTNRSLKGAVKLDIEVIEADRIANQTGSALAGDLRDWAVRRGYLPNTLTDLDGVIFDDEGNVVAYRVLKYHPGGRDIRAFSGDSDIVPASQMIHLFRHDRPGQHRGVPESTTALPLFILCRDYTLAVVQNARTVAKHTLMMKTQSGAMSEDGEAYPIDPFEAVDIDYDMSTYLPKGWEPFQLKAEQPATTYEMFRNAIWNEIARCADMPFNVAAGNSSKYNYASGRLDYQLWDRALEVERSEFEDDALDVIFDAWCEEATCVGIVPQGYSGEDDLPHEWFWTHRGHADPTKEATGQRTRLSNGTTNRRRELKTEGVDIDTHDRQAAKDFGMTVEEYRRSVARSIFNLQQPADAGETELDDDELEEAAELAEAAAA